MQSSGESPWRVHVELLGRSGKASQEATIDVAPTDRVGMEVLDLVKRAFDFAPYGKRQAPHGLALLAGFPTPQPIDLSTEGARSRALEKIGVIDGDTVYVQFARPPPAKGPEERYLPTASLSGKAKQGRAVPKGRTAATNAGTRQEDASDHDGGEDSAAIVKMRVLWLHGFGGTGATYESTNNKLVRSLRKMGIECVFPNGSLELPDETFDWMGHVNPLRRRYEVEKLLGFWSETMPGLIRWSREHGPFAGVVGFSGGGTTAHQLAAMRAELLHFEKSKGLGSATPEPLAFSLDYHPFDFDPDLPEEYRADVREFLRGLRFFVLVAALESGTEPAVSQLRRWQDPLKQTREELEAFRDSVIEIETEQALWLREVVLAARKKDAMADARAGADLDSFSCGLGVETTGEKGDILEEEVVRHTVAELARRQADPRNGSHVDPAYLARECRAHAFASLREERDEEMRRLRDQQIERQLEKMRRRILGVGPQCSALGEVVEASVASASSSSSASVQCESHTIPIDANGCLDVPTLHVSGQSDQKVTPSACEDLAWRFRGPVLLKHDGHHISPLKGAATRVIKAFLKACMERYLMEQRDLQ